MTVHWALDAEEHNHIVHDILSAHGVRTFVKSKSMLTEECPAAVREAGGVEVPGVGQRDRRRQRASAPLPAVLAQERVGRQREVPAAPESTFHGWYLKHRGGKG